MLTIWLESKDNCINDFLQHQTQLPDVCTSYCFLFLLRVLKTVLTNGLSVTWLIVMLIWWGFILISEFFQNHWLIKFIGFTGRLSNEIWLISKAENPRKQWSLPPSPLHISVQMKIWEQEGIISHFYPTCSPSISIHLAMLC